MPEIASGSRRSVAIVERTCREAVTADELLERLSHDLHEVVPHDGSAWFALDPVTMLATAPSRVEALAPELCDAYWHLEFFEHDLGLFTEVARSGGTHALRLSTDDRPARSIRYRQLMQPQGYRDSLRAVFTTGGSAWGMVDLYRESAAHPFTQGDVDIVQAISGVVAEALRRHIRAIGPPSAASAAPGLLVVDGEGRVLSSNEDAAAWLDSLWPGAALDGGPGLVGRSVHELRGHGMQLPTPLFALVARARAVADGREHGPSRLRMRDRRGRWVVLHASTLGGPGATDHGVAIMIEAAKSAEIAPIVIEAYSLTPREREVLGAIARGCSTSEIAAELFLSAHTVRDHVKAVFEKFQVSSRGELVARLFAEHYSHPLHATMVHG